MMEILTEDALLKYEDKKLKIPGLSDNQKLQAASEVCLTRYFYCIERENKIGLKISTDVKLDPQSKKDIDIQVCNNGLALNIEVKTPEKDIYAVDKFQAMLPHRFPGIERAENNESIKEISEILKAQSGKETQILKTNDNKVKDFIASANSKFTERRPNILNVLFIVCTSEQMGQYMNYLMNPQTGIITPNTYIKDLDYSKTDFIVLSNAEELISKNIVKEVCVCDFTRCVNLLIIPWSYEQINSDAVSLFTSLIPNVNKQFCDYMKVDEKRLTYNEIPKNIHYLFFWSDYLAECHPEFALNATCDDKDRRE